MLKIQPYVATLTVLERDEYVDITKKKASGGISSIMYLRLCGHRRLSGFIDPRVKQQLTYSKTPFEFRKQFSHVYFQ